MKVKAIAGLKIKVALALGSGFLAAAALSGSYEPAIFGLNFYILSAILAEKGNG